MKLIRLLSGSVIMATGLFLATIPSTVCAGDVMLGIHPTTIGPAPVRGVMPPMRPATPDPEAPAIPGNIYGVEAIAAFTARFELAAPENIINLDPNANFFPAGTFGPDPNFMVAVNADDGWMYFIDAATGIRFPLAPLPPDDYTGMTYDPTTDTFFLASTICGLGSWLYTVDPFVGAVFPVGEITNAPCAIALAADSSGDLYTYDLVGDNGLRVDKFTGAGTILGPLGFDANFAQGMTYDGETDTMYLAAFNNFEFRAELRSFDRDTGATTFLGVIGPGDLREFTYAAMPFRYFNKIVRWGNDFNFDGVPDRVVEVGTEFSGAIYGFSIDYANPDNPSAIIKDVVPSYWDVMFLGGSAPCEVIRADERRNLFSDNYITCYPGSFGSMYFEAYARCGDEPGNPACHPKECGAFYLNEGAGLYVGRSRIDQTEPICLAAVRDLNGGGIDYTGAGDEDGDGVDDYTEACINFTDPCDVAVPLCGDCVVQHPSAGCEVPACEALICGMDPFCCAVQWDDICVDEAAAFCVPDLCTVFEPISLDPNYTRER